LATQWIQDWKGAIDLNLQNELAEEWNQYTLQLKHCDLEDGLKRSKNKDSRVYTTKVGCAARMKEEVGEKKWWWKKIWKLNSPLKT